MAENSPGSSLYDHLGLRYDRMKRALGKTLPPLKRKKLDQMSRRIRVLTQEVSMFQQAMQGMRSTLQVDDLIKIAIRSVCKGMGFRRCGVFLVEPDGKHIRLAMGIKPNGKFEKGASRFSIRNRRGYNDQSDLIFGYKKYLLSNNVVDRYKEGLGDGTTIHNMALVPIYAGPGRPIGNLAVDNLNHYRHITKADIAFLSDYSTLLGLVIQSARNYKNAVSLSVTDPMTGLGNRRSFEEKLGQEIKRSQRYGKTFSLLIADIDFFKKVNDTYGHDVGDKVIKHIAQVLKSVVRDIDQVARIGGEEFAILLPEIPSKNLVEVIDRILNKVRQSKAPLPVEPTPMVTLSLGAATYKSGSVTPSKLFKLADESLYKAKLSGRNGCGPRLKVTVK